MTAIQLKRLLIHRITEIDDISFLNDIKAILDSKAQSQVLHLTPEQRMEINESKKDVEKGLFIEQSELDKEVEKWLRAK
ncbi:MAG TPA: hypothetical protein PKH79_01625 [Prolixibacteraceae bacterium]|nr:hypothetical protein [Prolixibacteraceae bacterium]